MMTHLHLAQENSIRTFTFAKNEGRKSSFRLTDGHMSFEKMLNWRQSTKNTKVELYSEVIL